MGHPEGEGYADFLRAEVPRLVPLARLLTGADDAAADLTRDALVRVGLRWALVRERADPHGEALTTLVRGHLGPLRAWRHRPVTPLPTGPADDTDQDLAGRLRALHRRTRAVLVLHCVEGLAPGEIGEHVGGTEAAVRVDLDGALATLRAAGVDDPVRALRELATEAPTPPGLPEAVLQGVRTRRRQRLGTGAAVAVLVAGLIAAVAVVGGSDDGPDVVMPTRTITMTPVPPLVASAFPPGLLGPLAHSGLPTRAPQGQPSIDRSRAAELAWFGSGLPRAAMDGAGVLLRTATAAAPPTVRGRLVWVVWIPNADRGSMSALAANTPDDDGPGTTQPFVYVMDAADGTYLWGTWLPRLAAD